MPAQRVKEAAAVAHEVAERLARTRVARQSAVQAMLTRLMFAPGDAI